MDDKIDFLLRWLIDEGEHSFDLPSSWEEKWRLFRALVNVRAPHSASPEFLAVQDELLRSLIARKGIADIDTLQPIRESIYLWRGDITTLKVDAIVNAANSGMLGCFAPNHGCIDNAIHTFAGIQLRAECAILMDEQKHSEPTGKAKITSAYNLPSRYVLHTVGPIVFGQLTSEHRELLASSYNSCLALAEQNDLESVAFCCISTGEFHFPNEEAASVAVKTVTNFLKTAVNIKRVVFNVFTERDERIYEQLLR